MDQRAKEQASSAFNASTQEGGRTVSFQEFVYLISSQALIQLGIAPNPVSGKVEEDLSAAQHAIEILAMLEQKTKGNLTSEEAKVLANALHNLRMRYVQAVEAKRAKKKES